MMAHAQTRATSGRSTRGWARARVYLIPVLVLLGITLPHLAQGDFRTDTGWYAAIGLSSVRHVPEAHGLGDALTLQAEPGKPFFNKPPLALWIHGIALELFGVNLAAARLPAILAACGCVLLTVGIVRRLGTRTQALLAGAALALTLEFFRRTKEISLDMWQLLFMLGAVRATVGALARAGGDSLKAGNGALSGALIGLALLCKPLVALLAGVILILWLAQAKRLSLRWVLAHLGAAVVVAAPWYALMAATHGAEFLQRHFVGEIADRATGATTSGPESRSGGGTEPPWFYALQLLTTYWPWLLPAVLGVIALARRELTARSRSLALLAIFWFAAWFLLLTIFPDRRPRYALLLWPAGSILAALWLTLPAAEGIRGVTRAVTAWGAPLAVLGGVMFAAIPVRVQHPPDPQWTALFRWMEDRHVTELWQGGFAGPSGARLYLQTGRWPIQTLDRERRVVAQPPDGALLIYHRRDRLAPGAREEVVFHEGDLSVTRLLSGPWEPLPVADPGETP